jgi:hypothetical protein
VLEGEPHVLVVRVLGVGWIVKEVRREEHVVPLDLVSAHAVGCGHRKPILVQVSLVREEDFSPTELARRPPKRLSPPPSSLLPVAAMPLAGSGEAVQ